MRVTITLSNATLPTIHKAGCGHLDRIRRRNDYWHEETLNVESLVAASLEYWQDIIYSDHGYAEGSVEAADEAEEYLSEFELGPCLRGLPTRVEGGRGRVKTYRVAIRITFGQTVLRTVRAKTKAEACAFGITYARNLHNLPANINVYACATEIS